MHIFERQRTLLRAVLAQLLENPKDVNERRMLWVERYVELPKAGIAKLIIQKERADASL